MLFFSLPGKLGWGEGPRLQQASGEHLPELLSTGEPLRYYLKS